MSISLPVIIHLDVESVHTSSCFSTCIYKAVFLKTLWWNLSCRIMLRIYINHLDTYKSSITFHKRMRNKKAKVKKPTKSKHVT